MPALPVQSVVAPSPRLSLWLAGFLECLVPGVGLLYAGSLVAGALVLGFTLMVGCLLLLFGVALVPHARPVARERYFLFVGAMLLAWLVARVVWAVGAAGQRNAAPPASTPSPTAHLTPGQLYGPPGPTPR